MLSQIHNQQICIVIELQVELQLDFSVVMRLQLRFFRYSWDFQLQPKLQMDFFFILYFFIFSKPNIE
jgi:hypothetical protein